MDKVTQYRPLEEHEDTRSSLELIEDSSLLSSILPPRAGRRKGTLWIKLALAKMSLFVYTAIVSGVTWTKTSQIHKGYRRYGTRFLRSPANKYIVYEPYVMEQWENENAPQYFGEPNEEIDSNWHELFKYQNLGFSRELMEELGREHEGILILLPDGTYFGSIMVFHHLHCLKNIQHALHPQYYELDNLQGQELAMHRDHTDHYLHKLMDAIMCQGDTSIITMLWQDNMFVQDN